MGETRISTGMVFLGKDPQGYMQNDWIHQKLRSKFTKVVTLLKIPTGQKSNMPVMAGNIRKEKPPLQPTSSRASLESAIKFMQAI